MIYAAEALLDLSALKHNYSIARRLAAGSKLYSVIKADGYGHGLQSVADALTESDGYAVGRMTEAVALRSLGIKMPILLLEGVFDKDEFEVAVTLNLDLVVHNLHQLQLIESLRIKVGLQLWIKVDVGMGRIGFSIEELPEVW